MRQNFFIDDNMVQLDGHLKIAVKLLQPHFPWHNQRIILNILSAGFNNRRRNNAVSAFHQTHEKLYAVLYKKKKNICLQVRKKHKKFQGSFSFG